jgi:hypothetical protein
MDKITYQHSRPAPTRYTVRVHLTYCTVEYPSLSTECSFTPALHTDTIGGSEHLHPLNHRVRRLAHSSSVGAYANSIIPARFPSTRHCLRSLRKGPSKSRAPSKRTSLVHSGPAAARASATSSRTPVLNLTPSASSFAQASITSFSSSFSSVTWCERPDFSGIVPGT